MTRPLLSILLSLAACAHAGAQTAALGAAATGAATRNAAGPAVAAGDVTPQGVAPSSAGATIDAFDARLRTTFLSQRGSFVYSPASVAMALAMTREGAGGETASEMDAVLGAGLREEAKALLPKLQSRARREQGGPTPPELTIANRLFGDARTPFVPAFLKTTKDDWGAPIEALDFRANPDGGRKTINGWIAGRTHDKIQELLARGTIDESTRLVLVNAIYMKAQWLTPFQEDATKPGPFQVGGRTKQVPTMHVRARATMGEHEGARILDLPYAAATGGPALSMTIVVPKQGDDVAGIESAYTREGIAPLVRASKKSGKIEISMPKFKVTASFQLGDALVRLGMKKAFTDDADFSGLSPVPTKISRVVHQAFAAVDEKGTEAAAATAVVLMEITSVHVEEKLAFDVDRPFLFFVRDTQSGAVIFSGRVVDPTS